MTPPSSNDGLAALLIIAIVYLVVSVAIYVWYAVALSKVFAKLGAEPWKAWVPVLNDAEVFSRGGVPGWSVVFSFIPIVNFYALYLRIVATGRINAMFGRGTGMTVLAIVLPPVWATMLASGSTVKAPAYDERLHLPPAVAGSPSVSGLASSRDSAVYSPPTPAPATPAPAMPAVTMPAVTTPVATTPAPTMPVVTAATATPPAAMPPAPTKPAPAPTTSMVVPPPPTQAVRPAPAPTPTTPMVVFPPPAPTPVVSPPPTQAARPTSAPAATTPVVVPPPTPVVTPPPPAPAPIVVHNPWAPDATDKPVAGDVPIKAARPMIAPAPIAPAPVTSAPLTPAPLTPAPVTPAPVTPAPVTPAPVTAAAAPNPDVSAEEDDDDYGETIAVDRRPRIRWTLNVDGAGPLPLPTAHVLLGRKPTSTSPDTHALSIPDDTRTLSKVHARLDLVDDEWTITDLNSTNGVLVVESDGTETLLDPGAAVRVRGRFILGKVGMSIGFEDANS